MRSRRSRIFSTVSALVAAAALGAPAANANNPADPTHQTDQTSPTNPTTPTVTPAGSGAATVVLPTGDRVVVHPGAQGGVTVAKDAGSSDAFATLLLGGDSYVVPAEAEPYLGHGLDLSLFDVTKRAAAKGGTAQIPVQLRFAAGVTPTAPAGVTFTAVSGQTATGYLTPESGRAFAQALRDAIKADLAAGRKAGSGVLFGGLASMTALGATTPVQPNYPMHILQLNTVDGTGAAASMPVVLINTDNARLYEATTYSYQGVAKVAVPAGHYAAIALDYIFDPQANTARQELVPVDDIVVPDSGPVPVATVDMRTATAAVSVTTQKPSTRQGSETMLLRAAAVGGEFGILLGGGAKVDTYVAPVPKPAAGSLYYLTDWVGAGPESAAIPYRYNISEVSDHIDANQAYAPADSSLATLKHTVDLDPSYGTEPPMLSSGVITPAGAAGFPVPVPGRVFTEYINGGLQWSSELLMPFAAVPPGSVPPLVFLDDDSRLFAAGQFAERTWGHAPTVPNFGRHPAGAVNQFGCQACAVDGTLDVLLGMLGDGNRDTTGVDTGATGNAELYWNGDLVFSGPNLGFVLGSLPAAPAKLRLVADYDRSSSGITQSTKTHTDVTVPYPGHDDPSMVLPAGTACEAAIASGDPAAPCQVLPALTLNYQLNALTDRNVSHSPVQNLVLRVGHLSYGDVGSKAHITSVQVAVSYDGGATWKDVPTHGTDGVYAAHWANPAPGGHVTLRVTASDCLGGSITQTVTDPYTVG